MGLILKKKNLIGWGDLSPLQSPIASSPAPRHKRSMLVIDDLSVRIAGRLLIDAASVQVPTGARVGLVGRNGAGKTTLFRVIAGDIAAEHGAVGVSARERIGRLAQEAPNGPESLIETVLAADSE